MTRRAHGLATDGLLTTPGSIAVPSGQGIRSAGAILFRTNTSGTQNEWLYAIDGSQYVLSTLDPGIVAVQSGYHLTVNGVPVTGSEQRWTYDMDGDLTCPRDLIVATGRGLNSAGEVTIVSDSAGTRTWTWTTSGHMHVAGIIRRTSYSTREQRHVPDREQHAVGSGGTSYQRNSWPTTGAAALHGCQRRQYMEHRSPRPTTRTRLARATTY